MPAEDWPNNILAATDWAEFAASEPMFALKPLGSDVIPNWTITHRRDARDTVGGCWLVKPWKPGGEWEVFWETLQSEKLQ